MIKKLLISFCATVLIVTSALAQTAVSGKVLDKDGNPIAGAAIKVKAPDKVLMQMTMGCLN